MAMLNKVNLKNLVLAVGAALSSNTLFAADKELLDILLSNGAINQAQYDELLAKETLSREDAVQISLGDGGGLNFSTAEGKFEVEVGGRLHLDYVDHSNDNRMGVAPISGTQIRRGRVEFDGVFNERWGFASEIDYAKNGVSIKDFKVGYETSGGTTIFAGHQKQPYSLSLEMSSNDEPFAERSIDNFLVSPFVDREIGIRTESSGDHWFLGTGLFGEGMKSGAQGNEGWGASFRFIYSPIIEEDKVVHLGIRGHYREIDASSPPVNIKDKTSDFSDLSIVNTGNIKDADIVSLKGPEFGVAMGPLYVFGEYTDAQIDRIGASSLNFDSWHVAAAWTLTGESRAARYRIDAGEFKNIRPTREFDYTNGGIGAWELGARYASINLNDGTFIGGEEDAVSFTLNWYPNRHVRFLADWTRIVDTDESNLIRLYAPDMDIFTLRSQYNF